MVLDSRGIISRWALPATQCYVAILFITVDGDKLIPAFFSERAGAGVNTGRGSDAANLNYTRRRRVLATNATIKKRRALRWERICVDKGLCGLTL